MSDLPENRTGHGVLVKAANGDVIRYDSSGLIMRLSDQVISDIAMRLPENEKVQSTGSSDKPTQAEVKHVDAEEHLEGVDAWNVRHIGEWLHFTANLPGKQGTRDYRRLNKGGAILADAPGALFGVLGLGGPKAALATQSKSDFPQHVLSPADDIGPVGYAGVEAAKTCDTLEPIREMTHEAMVADTLLNWQLEKYEPLRLFMARVETDSSHTVSQLIDGQACRNLRKQAENLSRAAERMGKTPRLFCVALDFALEDVTSSADEYRDGMIRLMDQIKEDLNRLGYHNPVFVTRFESGLPELTSSPILEGQWELIWNHSEHNLLYSAPSYMFGLDEFDRPTDDARREMAEMTAAAVTSEEPWLCPTFMLAEQSRANPDTIRVTARAMVGLVLDRDTPFEVGKDQGFRLVGADNGAKIESVSIASDDEMALLVKCDRPPTGKDLKISYAYGAKKKKGSYPANCGAVRDKWHLKSATGRKLKRFALPCLLPVRQGGADD